MSKWILSQFGGAIRVRWPKAGAPRLCFVVITVVLGGGVVPAIAAGRDIAAGGGKVTCPPGDCLFESADFGFSANSGPLGEEPQGHMSLDARFCDGSTGECFEFKVEAEVTCLAVGFPEAESVANIGTVVER